MAFPIPRRLGLAAEATGDCSVIRLGQALAAAVERGDPPAVATATIGPCRRSCAGCWRPGRQQVALAGSLHGLAAIYRKRAAAPGGEDPGLPADRVALVIGLSATLIFGLCLFLPFTTLLKELAIPE